MERDAARDLDNLIGKLKGFGLTENEAKVYSTLLLRSPLRPSKISEMSGVARAEVHRHLHSLEKRGFCLVVAGESKRYSAVQPDLVLSATIRQEENRRDIMKKTREQLASEWSSLQRPADAQNGVEKFQVLKDTQIALERGTRMISEAKSIARVILHEATIQNHVTSGILQNLRSLTRSKNDEAEPKAEIRVLLVTSSPNKSRLKDTLTKIGYPFHSKPKWISSPMMETIPDAVISDDKELFLNIAPTKASDNEREKEVRTVLTNVSSMIKPFTFLFDQNWSNATDLQ